MMVVSFRRSSTLTRLLSLASLMSGVLLTANDSLAEIILDDFDDSAEVTEISTGLGAMPYKPAITANVGDLDSTREMSIGGIQTVPRALFESSFRTSSALSAELTGHLPQANANSPIISFTSIYFFSPTDLTQGGQNNALLFDFLSYDATEQPTFFRVFARGILASESYVARSTDTRSSGTPFTTAIPFSTFDFRGGGEAAPDFSRLNRFIVDFYFLRPSEDIEWSFDLDRIRIGKFVIPEPASTQLLWCGAVACFCCRRG